MTLPIDKILPKLQGVIPHANDMNKWEAKCPSHDDNRQSLGIAVADDNKILLCCQAGCTVANILGAIGLEMSDLFPEDDRPERSSSGGGWKIDATYDYCDEAGLLLFQVVRIFPKDFRQRRKARKDDPPDKVKGGWIWSVKGTGLVLYRLPELLNSDPNALVFVVEGEKDVDNLRAIGLVATCNPMGAGKWSQRYNEALRDRRIVVIPDNDDAGRSHAATVVASLKNFATIAGTLPLPALPPKGDVSDWLAAGGTAAQLTQLAEAMLGSIPEPDKFPDPIPSSRLRRPVDEADSWLLEGYLKRGSVTQFSALWKAGKTTLLAHLLKAFEKPGYFCGKKVQASRVLYVTEESEGRWAERRDALSLHDHVEFLIRPFFSKPRPQRWLDFIRYVETLQQQRKYDLITFDTIVNLWPVKDENDASQVQEALMPLHALTGHAALLTVHHLRKGDGNEGTGARGSGAFGAFVDTIMELRRFNRDDRQDRKRVLTGYGRDDDTPDELIVELTEAGYQECGDRHDCAIREITRVLANLLPVEGPGFSYDEIIKEWPNEKTPTKARINDALAEGLKLSLWNQAGAGKKGNPYRYWCNVGAPIPDHHSLPGEIEL